MDKIFKYPRTRHIEGSRLQKGDEDLSQISFNEIKGKYIVIEEKVDGANSAISFSDGNLLLQSRGHYLTGGYRERHYNLFKQWAMIHKDKLYSILGERYVMYGEWLYAKHSIYYDKLPHYFLEFDIYDKENDIFLSTEKRHEMLENTPIVSVPVLSTGKFNRMDDVLKHLGNSNYISSDNRINLADEASKIGIDVDRVLRETENSMLMEGLYIKVEENGCVVDRMKYVRYSFLQTVEESQTHWLDRPIVPNKLDTDISDLY
jgi:hypothetical protein